MIWNVFRRRSAVPSAEVQWWRDADREAAAPTSAGVAQLRAALAAQNSSVDHEAQDEMLEAMEAVLAAAPAPLPTVTTQHRVIGADACHFTAPVTLVADVGVPGRLFLTSARCIFAGGKVQAWPWHRIRQVMRAGRDVALVVAGQDAHVHLQTNSYTDALLIVHLSERLRGR